MALLCLLAVVLGMQGVVLACQGMGAGSCVPQKMAADHSCCRKHAKPAQAAPIMGTCCATHTMPGCSTRSQCCSTQQPMARPEAPRGVQLAVVSLAPVAAMTVAKTRSQTFEASPSPPPKPVFDLKTDLRI